MIRTLIIEDELPAARRLSKILLEADPEIEIIGHLESVKSAVQWLRSNPAPDLMMLDIQLADGLSFDIFSQIGTSSFVIFTTAYDEYAIRAFELNSVDYLLKPVDKVKLARSIDKYKKLKGLGDLGDLREIMERMNRREPLYKQRFSVNIGDGIRIINTSDAALFYTLEKSTFLCTFESRNFGISYPLEKLEELLDPTVFFRISRQHIINFHAIEKIQLLSKSRIAIKHALTDVETLLVSTARTAQFRQWLER